MVKGKAGTVVPNMSLALTARRQPTLSHSQAGGNRPCAADSLLLGIRRGQHLFTGGRQLRQRHWLSRLRRLLRRLGMDDRILEPVGEIAGAAALAGRRLRLALAWAAAGRASDADMEVIVMAVHRPHLVQPAAGALGLAAP